jgi:hypothetical protein
MLMWAEVYEVGRGGVVHAVSGRNINSFCFVLQCYFVLELLVHIRFFPFVLPGREIGPLLQTFMYAHFVLVG